MAKLIQICASENDLFGLDVDGAVYHYNFSTSSWVRLGSGQREHGGSAPAEGQPPRTHAAVVEEGSPGDADTAVPGRHRHEVGG